MASLAQCGESTLLSRIKNLCDESQPGVIIGVGDDAAALTAIGPASVISSDMLVENEDFSFSWATGRDIGIKAAAVNLSDMAAMGAQPRALVLCIAAAPALKAKLILDIVRGVRDMGRRFNAPLVGGDLSQIDGPLTLAVTVLGEAKKSRLLTRYLGEPGDLLAVTGSLGRAAAGLHLLAKNQPLSRTLKEAQLRPQPRVEVGRILADWGKVRSCADISDGLIRDALHTVGPKCGVNLYSSKLPIHHSVRRVAKAQGSSSLAWALAGGEDFELVFSFPKEQENSLHSLAKAEKLRLSVVGEVVKGRGVWLDGSRLPADIRAFEHFRS